MEWIRFAYLFLGVLMRPSNAHVSGPETVLNCCEGDILLLLDSSGSVSSYEFLRLLHFLSELLQPFSLGYGHVRVGLLQVGTEPHLEFGLDAYNSQTDLQGALLRTRQLQGDTNTEAALRQVQGVLTKAGGETKLSKVLLWLTDGVQPGNVNKLMAELRREGVVVLAISTGRGNYQVLRNSVTPPIESHLHFVDIDDISIITDDLREAIIELIRAERLLVTQLTSSSAVLQWRPVLGTSTGYYHLRYTVGKAESGDPQDGASSQYLPGDSSWVELTNLHPETTYTAFLTPEYNQEYLNTLTVSFTTLPDVLSPAVVLVSESGLDRVRVSWGPLQPSRIQRYRVEYGAIPSGQVQIVSLRGDMNSTLLTGLQPGTQYLVTVSALYSTGTEKAMSARICTQEMRPALNDLQLIPVGRDKVQVQWHCREEGLRGYWLSWQKSDTQSSSPLASSTLYLPPGSFSASLTYLAPSTRVCVSPVYNSGRGDGLCCTIHTHTGCSTNNN
ncbi:von Willebrand factor A domain-containing protein 1-like [Hypomesus transpacificus]|uniref:von Willebrand factor A domain-containing protein 1-like n=1 Tax=Hypomesus transpacificus TaxID=137520 RepID=UPI001F073AC7|nr:von Willebrand factor A domain-containing protein 1-like [Hypomesus transpacificus]